MNALPRTPIRLPDGAATFMAAIRAALHAWVGGGRAAAVAVALCTAAVLALPDGAAAQTPVTDHTVAPDEGAPPPSATLADAAWLEGHWVGTGLGSQAEEVWLAPAGGAMPGMFRLLDEGEVVFYELWALVEEEGSLVLRLKHFDAGMAGWEEKDEMVVFRLVDHDDSTLWFDGLTMKRVGADELRVWVAMQSRDGAVNEGEFIYRRRTS